MAIPVIGHGLLQWSVRLAARSDQDWGEIWLAMPVVGIALLIVGFGVGVLAWVDLTRACHFENSWRWWMRGGLGKLVLGLHSVFLVVSIFSVTTYQIPS